jgi:starch-binding outer membrane protein, SusD/RagB family
MNFKKIKYTFLFTTILFFGCNKDFLEVDPQDALTVDSFFQTEAELLMTTGALYNVPWFDWNDKSAFEIGDGSAGNINAIDDGFRQYATFVVTSANPNMSFAWSSFYQVVANANTIMEKIKDKAPASIPQAKIKSAIGECRFMRGLAYFYLAQIWGDVPIIESNTAIVNSPIIPKNNIEDVFEFVIRDFTYAAENLPATITTSGRVTSWSAKGMLAMVYLTRSGLNQSGTRNQADLDQAKALALDVAENSPYSLMSNYKDLFLTANDNNSESLMAFQWEAFGDWGVQNTRQAYHAPSSHVTGSWDGWGTAWGATANLIEEFGKETGGNKDAARRQASFMLDGDYYPELLTTLGGFTYPEDVNAAGTGTISHSSTNIKKYIVGRAADNGGEVDGMRTSINTYVLRLSDVYLILAEATLGNSASTTDADALKYFNMVRTRAGVPTKSSITMDDIKHERRVEFAFEGKAWFDLVRWHYYDAANIETYVANQRRGVYTDIEAPYDLSDLSTNSYTNLVIDVVSSADFVFPIPEAEAVFNPKLLEPAVSYTFTDGE